MNVESYREFCLSLKEVQESFPFGEDVIVFKVCDKIFSLAYIDIFDCFKVKNRPEINIELRELYPEITSSFHMNKKHWNDIAVNGNLSDKFLKKQILDSYNLVVSKLPKKSLLTIVK